MSTHRKLIPGVNWPLLHTPVSFPQQCAVPLPGTHCISCSMLPQESSSMIWAHWK
uniref:Uncharacterized protein n=1 Tax=Arundo donax TaxID=35708 RepID=A0A0A8Z4A8_ARUDO